MEMERHTYSWSLFGGLLHRCKFCFAVKFLCKVFNGSDLTDCNWRSSNSDPPFRCLRVLRFRWAYENVNVSRIITQFFNFETFSNHEIKLSVSRTLADLQRWKKPFFLGFRHTPNHNGAIVEQEDLGFSRGGIEFDWLPFLRRSLMISPSVPIFSEFRDPQKISCRRTRGSMGLSILMRVGWWVVDIWGINHIFYQFRVSVVCVSPCVKEFHQISHSIRTKKKISEVSEGKMRLIPRGGIRCHPWQWLCFLLGKF